MARVVVSLYVFGLLGGGGRVSGGPPSGVLKYGSDPGCLQIKFVDNDNALDKKGIGEKRQWAVGWGWDVY